MPESRNRETIIALHAGQKAHRIASDIRYPEVRGARPPERDVRWYIHENRAAPESTDADQRPPYQEHPFTPVELPAWLKERHKQIDNGDCDRAAFRNAAIVIVVLFTFVIALLVYLRVPGQMR